MTATMSPSSTIAWPAYHYASAKLVTPERHHQTVAEVAGVWDSEEEAAGALDAECAARGISMAGRRVLFTVIPELGGRQLPELRRTLDRCERPLWTDTDLRRAVR